MYLKRLFSWSAGAGVALGLTLLLALPAQEVPPPASPGPAADSPPAIPASPAAEPELRRLDSPEPPPAAPAAPVAADAADPVAAQVEQAVAEAAVAVEAAEAEVEALKQDEAKRPRGRRNNEIVRIGGDALLPAGESAGEVVAIMGNAVADGHVNGSVVAVMGHTTVNGRSGDAVAVLGNVTINGEVHGQVVAVLGNVQLGPRAVVHGEIVCVGGRVDRAPGAVVHGGVQQIGEFKIISDGLEGLRAWFHECLVKGRPLAFDARVLWAWGIAGAFFAFYVLLALVFQRSVVQCAQTLEQQPGMTVVAAVLTALLVPVVTLLLSFIGVGLLLIPLVMIASLYGKTVFLAWLGRRFLLPMGVHSAAVAVLIGGVILLLLYTIPFAGFLFMKLTSALGLGMVVYTVILANRRPVVAPVGGAPFVPPVVPVAATTTSGFAAGPSAAPAAVVSAEDAPFAAPSAGVPPVPGAVPVVPIAASAGAVPPPLQFSTLPRVGFWLRLVASFLDALVVGFAMNAVGLEDYFVIGFATYCAVLWVLRGTTIGGIICGLKVVRLDDRKIDWTVAVVRVLGGFLSVAAIGLGFVWVAFDKEAQSWHDKIAGTTIVRVPRGVSLV